MKEGTILNCNSYGENGYMNFEAEVIQVSDYAVDGDSSYYYYGDSNQMFLLIILLPRSQIHCAGKCWRLGGYPAGTAGAEY